MSKIKAVSIKGRHVFTKGEISELKRNIRSIADDITSELDGGHEAVLLGMDGLKSSILRLRAMERANRHAERGDWLRNMLSHAREMCVRFAGHEPDHAAAWAYVASRLEMEGVKS